MENKIRERAHVNGKNAAEKRNQIIFNVIYVLGNEDTNRSQQHSINGVLEEHNAADDSRKALK